jgi:hypothetical protein
LKDEGGNGKTARARREVQIIHFCQKGDFAINRFRIGFGDSTDKTTIMIQLAQKRRL